MPAVGLAPNPAALSRGQAAARFRPKAGRLIPGRDCRGVGARPRRPPPVRRGREPPRALRPRTVGGNGGWAGMGRGDGARTRDAPSRARDGARTADGNEGWAFCSALQGDEPRPSCGAWTAMEGARARSHGAAALRVSCPPIEGGVPPAL